MGSRASVKKMTYKPDRKPRKKDLLPSSEIQPYSYSSGFPLESFETTNTRIHQMISHSDDIIFDLNPDQDQEHEVEEDEEEDPTENSGHATPNFSDLVS